MLATLGEIAEQHHWGVVEELLAMNVELVRELQRTLIAVNSKRSAQLPPPIRIPRPGDGPKTVRPGDLLRNLTRR